ncbi:hypothetical protein CYMTET_40444, partial [Cymbomonas tetramitiformis]
MGRNGPASSSRDPQDGPSMVRETPVTPGAPGSLPESPSASTPSPRRAGVGAVLSLLGSFRGRQRETSHLKTDRKADDADIEKILTAYEQNAQQEKEVALAEQRAVLVSEAAESQSAALAQQRKKLEEWAARDKELALAAQKAKLESRNGAKERSEQPADRGLVIHSSPEEHPGECTPQAGLQAVSPLDELMSRRAARSRSMSLRDGLLEELTRMQDPSQNFPGGVWMEVTEGQELVEDMIQLLDVLREHQHADDAERLRLEEQQDEYVEQIHRYQAELANADAMVLAARKRGERKSEQLTNVEAELQSFYEALLASETRCRRLEKQLARRPPQGDAEKAGAAEIGSRSRELIVKESKSLPASPVQQGGPGSDDADSLRRDLAASRNVVVLMRLQQVIQQDKQKQGDAEMEALRGQLEDACAALEKSSGSQNKKLQNAARKVKQLNSALADSQREATANEKQWEARRAELEAAVKVAGEKLEAAEVERQRLEQELREACERLAEAKEAEEEVRAVEEKWSAVVKEAEEKLHNAEGEKERLEQELEEAQEQLEAAKAAEDKLRAAETEAEHLKHALQLAGAQLEAATQEAEIEAMMKEGEEKMRGAEAEKQRLEQELQEAKE